MSVNSFHYELVSLSLFFTLPLSSLLTRKGNAVQIALNQFKFYLINDTIQCTPLSMSYPIRSARLITNAKTLR